MFTCNPALVPCITDQDCTVAVATSVAEGAEKCGNDFECVLAVESDLVNYLNCLVECNEAFVALPNNTISTPATIAPTPVIPLPVESNNANASSSWEVIALDDF